MITHKKCCKENVVIGPVSKLLAASGTEKVGLNLRPPKS